VRVSDCCGISLLGNRSIFGPISRYVSDGAWPIGWDRVIDRILEVGAALVWHYSTGHIWTVPVGRVG
jgi:hypothetical protein